jgi:hypothetical protein
MLENHFRIKIVLLLVLLKFVFLNANTINSTNRSKENNIEIDANSSGHRHDQLTDEKKALVKSMTPPVISISKV